MVMRLKKLTSILISYIKNSTIESAIPVYKKGVRVIVNFDTVKNPEYYVGTVTAIRNGLVYVTFDDGDRGNYKPTRSLVGLVGITESKKKRKSEIPKKDIDKWLYIGIGRAAPTRTPVPNAVEKKSKSLSYEELLTKYTDMINVPEGFSLKIAHRKTYSKVVLDSKDIKIKIRFKKVINKAKYKLFWDGSTEFKNENDKWTDFDFDGDFTSFSGNEIRLKNINNQIFKQLRQVKRYLERKKKDVIIPDIGVSISNKRKEEIIKDLDEGKSVTITPSKYATSYRLVTKLRDTSARLPIASSELAFFFEQDSLFVEKINKN